MTLRKFTSLSTFILLSALLIYSAPLSAQKKIEVAKDTTALFQGAVAGVDLFGAIQRQVSDYGQYEAFLRLNLKGKYFPTFELGRGDAEHKDQETKETVKSKGLYGRVGCDFNVMKNKHDIYKVLVGFRYGYSKFDFEYHNPGVKDPIWLDTKACSFEDKGCYAHWVEGVFGVDAKIIGPVHLGWTVRYRRRIASSDCDMGDVWYVPGFGRSDKTNLGGTFNISIGI